jgi:hypothetical protein
MRFSPLARASAALATVLFGAGVHAATIIETVSGPNRVPALMTVENGKSKMQMDLMNYMLIDPGADQYLFVVQDKKLIVDMNAAPPPDPQVKQSLPARVTLSARGAGPKIAGFPTRLHQLYANGSLCLSTYLSREAMARTQLKEFHANFANMQGKYRQAMRKAGMQYAPCDDAQAVLAGRYAELGLAMRTVDPGGQLLQEVVKIETGAPVASNLYDLPAGFARVTHEEFLRRMEGGGDAGKRKDQ